MPFDQWQKLPPIVVPRCDICNKQARWQHPAGGRRCEQCPRPTTDKPICTCHQHYSGVELATLCGHIAQCPLFATNFTKEP